MKLKRVYVLAALLVTLALPSFAGDAPKIIGKYSEVPGRVFSFDGRTVEVTEFLSFYCGHCYQFEKSIPVIKGNFPKKINWKIIPVHWGKASPKPGEAYYLAEEAGKGEQMKKALFEALFLEKKDIGNIEVLEDIGARIGMGFDFSARLRAGEKAEAVARGNEMMREYHISETPTVVIAGNLMTNPGMLNHNVDVMRDNVILILKSLFKK